MIFKKDNFIYGITLGLVAPILGFIIFKFVKFEPLTTGEMFQWLKLNPNLITASISVSLMANAILFTVFINGRMDRTAKGIFLMTVLYALLAMFFKYY